jgi:hypothetical protein
MSCDPVYIRAGDSLTDLRMVYVQSDADDAPAQALPASDSIVEFRAGNRVLLTLTEGNGIDTLQPDGQLLFSATADQTSQLAPPLGVLAHVVNLAWRNFDPDNENAQSETIADLQVTVLAQEVSRP